MRLRLHVHWQIKQIGGPISLRRLGPQFIAIQVVPQRTANLHRCAQERRIFTSRERESERAWETALCLPAGCSIIFPALPVRIGNSSERQRRRKQERWRRNLINTPTPSRSSQFIQFRGCRLKEFKLAPLLLMQKRQCESPGRVGALLQMCNSPIILAHSRVFYQH